MNKNIEPQLKLISAYLKIDINEKFVIPEYQRGYSWTINECDKLWQDIEGYIASSEVNESGKKDPYFFGTIIADCSDANNNMISLIDGQQRTTTFILLLKALFMRIQGLLPNISRTDETEALYEGLKERRNMIIDILYKKNVDDRLDILNDWNNAKGISLLENRSINELKDYKLELQKILEAKDFDEAEYACYKIPRRKNENKYTNFFKNFKFFYNKLSDYSETKVNTFARVFLKECQIIEIRSWNTEQAITMFNSLNSTGLPLSDADIISAQMYSHAGDDKTPYIDKWENITKTTNSLSSRRIINIDSVLQQYMYIWRAEKRVYMSAGNQPDVTTPGLRRFYTSDTDSRKLLNDPLALCENFDKIFRIWDAIKDYPIIKLLMKFNDNTKIFLMCYLYRFNVEDITEDLVGEIAECLIKLFSILELVDSGYSSSKFKTFLFGEATRLVKKDIPINDIKSDFANHIRTNWNEDDIKKLVKEYDKNVLVFLNEYLYAKSHDKIFDFTDTVNIEHIMPASGHNIAIIRRDAGIQTPEEFAGIVNKQGNKILLEDDINKSIGNEWFKTKKQTSIKDKSGYKDSGYHIAIALTNYPKDVWTKGDIETITSKVADRIADFIFGI